MKYITKPKAPLPNGRMFVEESFISQVVTAVNGLVDACEELKNGLEALEKRVANHKTLMDDRLFELRNDLQSTNEAVSKIAEAFETMLGGTNK